MSSSSSSPPPASSSSASASARNPSSDVSPQQIGKAFVVQYYRLLHEHPESLHRFYSTASTLMFDDPHKTVSGIENIEKRIGELSLKQRHVKIRQVDCHSTVGSSVVAQVCGEISVAPVTDNQTPVMKRFVQTFVLAPTAHAKQKYYVHNDIFRYQDGTIQNSLAEINLTKITSTPEAKRVGSSDATPPKPPASPAVQIPVTPSAVVKIDFSDNAPKPKDNQQQKAQEQEAPSKPKSYRDAIGKKEKVAPPAAAAAPAPAPTTNTTGPTTEAQSTAASAPAATAAVAATGNKAAKTGKQKAPKSANKGPRTARGHPQDANDYYDESWYYGGGGGGGGGGEEGYLHTGYVDDQEVFVGNLSAQVTEEEIHELFRPYGRLLLVRIGNTGTQVGAANFAFVVCQSIEMAKAIVADHETLLQNQQVKVEAKKRRPFPHTFRPTYPTAASPTNYQSTGYPASYYQQSASAPFYDGGVRGRGARRGGKGVMQ